VYCAYGAIFNTAVFQYVVWRNYKQQGSCKILLDETHMQHYDKK